MVRRGWLCSPLLLLAFVFAAEQQGRAQAVRQNTPFRVNVLPRGDDTYTTSPVSIGFPINFFGVTRASAWVTHNGNIALTDDGALFTFTPATFGQLRREIIAPFFADADTRNLTSGTVSWGTDTVDGKRAFAATWTNVGYFGSHADKLNTFQVVLIDRSVDTGLSGDFDMEFNYDKIQWETGDADGGTNGAGGISASVGYSNGTGLAGTYFELQGSRIPGSFLDSNLNGLRYRTLGSSIPGRLVIQVRNGVIPLRSECNTPTGTVNIVYNGLLASSGGATPHTWTVPPVSGSLPPGLTLTPDGQIQGVPSLVGSYPFTTRVTDSRQQASTLSCTINITPCAFTLSPNPANIAKEGGDTSFAINMTQACPWTATTNASWIRILNAGTPVTSRSGNGQSSVSIRVAANTGAARSGTITVNDQTLTVVQAGTTPQGPLTLNPSSATFSAPGGSGSFQVGSGPYTATENLDWVAITSGASGSAAGTVSYTVSAYTGAQARSGQILVNETPFSITQNPPSSNCTYSLSSSSANFVAAGGVGSTFVITGDGCGWTMSSSAPWVTVSSGNVGTTHSQANFTVAANTGAQRSAILTIAGLSFTVTQNSGVDCPTAFSPANALFLASGSSGGTVQLNTPCAWTVSSNAAWLRLTGAVSGSGPSTLNFTVDPNTAAQSRSGLINAVVAGRSVGFPVTQSGPSCSFSLSSRNILIPAGGGSTTLTVNTLSGCSWSGFSSPAFGSVSPTSGLGTAGVTVSAPANPGAERTTQATIAGQTFTIRQPSQQTIGCTASGPSQIPNVRYSLEAELTGTPTFTCTGSPGATGISGDVLVTLNTRVTSKIIADKVEALLLIGDPAVPVLGTNAFQGTLDGNNAVRFPNIPIGIAGSSAARLFRIVNLRADANTPASNGNDITATLEFLAPTRPVAISNNQNLIIARRAAPVDISLGTPTGTGTVTLPVTYRELLPNTFRVKLLPAQNPSQLPLSFETESGYINSATLGPKIGFADNGFRLQMKLTQVPAGVRVLVDPTVTSGQTRADLMAQDPRGLGIGVQTGADREVTITNGEGTITYEITAANSASLETLTFNVRFLNTTVAAVNTMRNTAVPACGPVATGLPANGVLPVPRCSDPGAPAPRYRSVLFGGTLVDAPSAVRLATRAPGGNATAVVNTEIVCEAEGGCPDAIVRGNIEGGAGITGCQAPEGSTCTISGDEVKIEISSLDQGERVVTPIAAELLFDEPQSIFLRFRGTSCTGLSCSSGEVERCYTNFSSFPNPPATGIPSGSFQLYPCGAWTITSSVPWIRFRVDAPGTTLATTVSGNNVGGPVTILYVIDSNATGTFRNATVSITGFPGTLTMGQPPTNSGPGPQGSGLRFVPITPCRLLETRPVYAGTNWTGQNGPPALAAGVERTLQITNSRCGIPASAEAFVLNVTTDTAYANTGPVDMLTIWPADKPKPDFGTVRTSTGGYVANSAIVAASAAGAIKILSSQSVNITLDISGYFTQEASGLMFYPTPSCRPIDTRSIPAYTAGLLPPFGNSRMNAQETRTFRLPASTRCSIPAAQAYSMQFTLTPGVEASGNPVAYLSAWNTGGGEPPVSNLNSLSGFVMSNAAMVPARADGSIDVKTYNDTNFLGDVNGYFAPDDGSGRGLLYYPVTQCRVMNTQDATLPAPFGSPAMSADRELVLPNSTRCPGLPAAAKAWAVNVTAIPNGSPLAFLSLWQGGTPWPAVSQLNAFEGQTVSNAAIVPGSTSGSIAIKVNNPAHVVLEVAGFFARP